MNLRRLSPTSGSFVLALCMIRLLWKNVPWILRTSDVDVLGINDVSIGASRTVTLTHWAVIFVFNNIVRISLSNMLLWWNQSGQSQDLTMSHNDVFRFTKKVSLKGFSKNICKHQFRGTIFNHNVLPCYNVLCPIVSNVNVPGSLSCGSLTLKKKKKNSKIYIGLPEWL